MSDEAKLQNELDKKNGVIRLKPNLVPQAYPGLNRIGVMNSRQPMMPRVFESGRARYFAATAVAAPVRIAVIQVASITEIGKPVAGSFRIIRPEMYGNSRLKFSGYLLTHLIPAADILGRYAGIA
jgi:hypothetical protein